MAKKKLIFIKIVETKMVKVNKHDKYLNLDKSELKVLSLENLVIVIDKLYLIDGKEIVRVLW